MLLIVRGWIRCGVVEGVGRELCKVTLHSELLEFKVTLNVQGDPLSECM